jgi:hypothetical protein
MLADAQRGEMHAVDLMWRPLDQITQTPEELNSRQRYAAEDIAELAESIRVHGITSPVLVRPITAAEAAAQSVLIQGRSYPPVYVLVAGNRRLLAAQQAGLQALPALIRAVKSEQAFLLNHSATRAQQRRAGPRHADTREPGGRAGRATYTVAGSRPHSEVACDDLHLDSNRPLPTLA